MLTHCRNNCTNTDHVVLYVPVTQLSHVYQGGNKSFIRLTYYSSKIFWCVFQAPMLQKGTFLNCYG